MAQFQNIKAKRAFIISDTHFGARSNSVEWLNVMMDWFDNDFIPKVKSMHKPGDILIHCGDVYDNRQSINLLVMHKGIDLFERLSKIFVDGIYIIAGNHDVMRKTSNDISSLDTLKYIPGVHILKEPVIGTFIDENQKTNALFMPWRTDETEEKECIKEHLAANKCSYLFCHTNIRSLSFDRNRQVEEGLTTDDLVKFGKVYSGHIHWGQVRKNVTMVGNPYEMTRSDAGNQKGWYLLDIHSGDDQFYQNTHSPRFNRIYLDKWLERPLSDLITECKNNRVDLFVPSSYLMKFNVNLIIDELSKVASKLEIIPFEKDLQEQSEDIAEGKTYQIYDLCEKYVNNMGGLSESDKEKMLKKLNTTYLKVVNENV